MNRAPLIESRPVLLQNQLPFFWSASIPKESASTLEPPNSTLKEWNSVRHLSLMTKITYRDWILDCDVEATRVGYQTIAVGGAESCDCAGCRNFLAQRECVYPAEVLNLFDELGVNYKRDAETYHTARLEPGLHLYGRWFHFVGAILTEPIGPATLNNFTIDFFPDRALAAKAFENQRLVQIEITVKLPWVLSEPELN
jgi:hypothetical protein